MDSWTMRGSDVVDEGIKVEQQQEEAVVGCVELKSESEAYKSPRIVIQMKR